MFERAADTMKGRRKRVLAIASSGGHWEQIMLVRSALADCDVCYATTLSGLAERAGLGSALVAPDFNARTPLKLCLGSFVLLRIVWVSRADIVLSTGAAPGVIALAWAKLMGKRTIWLDSVANVERLSVSGRLAGVVADLWLTQWAHLARERGPAYAGSVL